MQINSDINILGGLSDLRIIEELLRVKDSKEEIDGPQNVITSMKTIKAFKRYEKAINNTLLRFSDPKVEVLILKIIKMEKITTDSLFLLFWNASLNNELLNYLNQNVYFTALYSGRSTIKKDEVIACLKDLKTTEAQLQKWSDSTIEITASKYLTLLCKFNLLEGRVNKKILHHNISDKVLILFLYWLVAVNEKPNILESPWISYCFIEREILIQIILQKKFMKFFNVNYSGDKLKIETLLSYEGVYDELK